MKTGHALALALKDMMAHQPLETISVLELSKKCGVSRKTFYYHYHDTYDLLTQVFLEEKIAGVANASTFQELIALVFDYYKNNQAVNYFSKDAPIERVRLYVNDVIEGINSGLFKYLCHPDLFMYSQNSWNDDLEFEARRLLKDCQDKNFPIELNICGMRRPTYDGVHYGYPNRKFHELIKEYNLKVVLGIDAHDPVHFNNGDVAKALEFAKECGFEVDLNYQM